MPGTAASIRHILSLALASVVLGILPAPASAANGAHHVTTWFGRWTVDEAHPRFTARGLRYRTVDIVACGRAYCGISVGEQGQCAETLFRVPVNAHDGDDVALLGRGRWGTLTKTVQLDWDGTPSDPDHAGPEVLEIFLGDGHDFGGRSDNMPRFHASYRRLGNAVCTAR